MGVLVVAGGYLLSLILNVSHTLTVSHTPLATVTIRSFCSSQNGATAENTP